MREREREREREGGGWTIPPVSSAPDSRSRNVFHTPLPESSPADKHKQQTDKQTNKKNMHMHCVISTES